MSIDPKFRRDNCGPCRHALFAGVAPGGGYRIQRCLFAYSQAIKNRAAQKGGVKLDDLSTCPDPTKAVAA